MRTKRVKPSHIPSVSGRTRNLRSADTASSEMLEIEFISDDGDVDAKHNETSNTSKKKRNAQKENQQNSPTLSKRARHLSASSHEKNLSSSPEKNLSSSPKSVSKSAKKSTVSSPAKNSHSKRSAAGSKRPYTPPPSSKSSKSDANDKTTSSGKSSKSSSPSKPSKGAPSKSVPKRAREMKKPTSPTSAKRSSSKTNAANASASPSKRAPQRGVKRRAASGQRARRPRKTRRTVAPLEVLVSIPVERLACESAPAHLHPLHPLYHKYPQLLRAPHVSVCNREQCLQQVSDLKHCTSCITYSL